jgi:hypothetical protein
MSEAGKKGAASLLEVVARWGLLRRQRCLESTGLALSICQIEDNSWRLSSSNDLLYSGSFFKKHRNTL